MMCFFCLLNPSFSHPFTVDVNRKYMSVYYYYFFFYSVLRPFKDYFNSYETDKSVGGAKAVDLREKSGTPTSRT